MSAGRRPATTAVALALALLVASSPSSARAAGEIEWLPGRTLAAAGFDLDADGDHELVRLVEGLAGASVLIEVWDLVEGEWAAIGAPAALRPEGDDPASGTRLVGQLISWQLNGRERLLAVSSHAAPPDTPSDNCCLAIGEVTLERGGPALEPIRTAGLGAANLLQTLDVDADGTDELLIQTYGFSQPFSLRVELVRWEAGSGFAVEDVLANDPQASPAGVGNSDGVAGDDVFIGPDNEGVLSRLTWRDGRIVTERWPTADYAYPSGFVGGRFLVQQQGLRLMDWVRDEEPVAVAASSSSMSGPVFVATSGGEVAIVVPTLSTSTGTALSSAVLGPDLRAVGEVVIPETQPLWALAGAYTVTGGSLYPFLGSFPLRNDQAEVWQAGIVVSAGGHGGYSARETSPFVGIVPIAVVGPNDAWIAAGPVSQFSPPGSPAYLFDVGRGASDEGSVRLLRRDSLNGFAAEGELVGVTIEDAIEVIGDDGGRQLTAGRDGFVATVTAPVGTSVVVVNDGSAEVTNVTDRPVDIRVLPRSTRSEGDEPFNRSVVFVLPDGRFITESWTGEFIGGDPELSATAATDSFTFGARIDGQTMAGSQVWVGDASTTADGEGRFTISVDAAPWPQDIVVAAEDPLGRTVEMELEVIGLVDYRGWPWLAIIGVLVAVAGIALYVRVPRTRLAPEPTLPEQPTLEEIEV